MKRAIVAQTFAICLLTALSLFLFSAVALAQDEPKAAENAESGVLLVTIGPDSPAATAGLQRGDIVLRVGDVEVNDAMALQRAIGDLAPGDEVVLTVLHGDDEHEVTVTLGDRNGRAFLGVAPFAAPMMARDVMGGRTTVAPARPGPMPGMPPMPAMMAITDTANLSVTLMIAEVADGSPAAEAGLQPKEAITAINGVAITKPDALMAAVQALAPGDQITLTVGGGMLPPNGTIPSVTAAADSHIVVVTLGEHPDQAKTAYLGVRIAPRMLVTRREMRMPPTDAQGIAPRDRLFRRFPSWMPRFLSRLWEWWEGGPREPWDGQGPRFYQHRDVAPNGDMPKFRQDGSDEEFTMPFVGDYLWFEAPAAEDVFYFYGAPGSIEEMGPPALPAQLEGPLAPNAPLPALPTLESVDGLI